MGYWNKKTTVEDCRSLRASDFHKWGVFKAKVGYASGSVVWKNYADEVISSIGYSFSQQPYPRLTLSYAFSRNTSEEKQDFNYDIKLSTTACNYGGLRYWFICPLLKNGFPCRNRVTKLYLPPGGDYFGCRHCYELTYQSCQEHDARVDRLVKYPELLDYMLESPNLSSLGLACKAVLKIEKRLKTIK